MFELIGIGEDEFLTYKERPLVRKDMEIFYGDLNSSAHVEMRIMTEKIVSGFTIPDEIVIQLFEKDVPMPKRNYRSKGLFDALNLAASWLDGYK